LGVSKLTKGDETEEKVLYRVELEQVTSLLLIAPIAGLMFIIEESSFHNFVL